MNTEFSSGFSSLDRHLSYRTIPRPKTTRRREASRRERDTREGAQARQATGPATRRDQTHSIPPNRQPKTPSRGTPTGPPGGNRPISGTSNPRQLTPSRGPAEGAPGKP